MRNPFRYGQIVGPEAFCDRQQEQADLARAMENGERLFVLSERRMGKTSLVLRAMDRLPPDRYLKLYVDLWPTEGPASLARRIGQAFGEALGGETESRLQAFKRYVSRIQPSVSLDDSGRPTFSLSLSDPHDPAPDLEDILAAPARAAADRGLRLVVVFDEFQRIFDYEDDLVERTLRSSIQEQRDAAFVILGSRKHLLQSMLLDQNRPLYRAGGHYPLGPIATEFWKPFIRERFVDAQKTIDAAVIDHLCALTGGHPFYTQHLCHSTWELCEPGAAASAALVDEALGLLLARERHAYSAQWESLTLNQRRLLVGLALEEERPQVNAAAFYSRYGISSPSSVQRAADALIARDIVDRDNGSYLIVDRFLRLWVRREHGGQRP
jgi:hypothetical protein